MIVPDMPMGTKVKKSNGKNTGSVLFLAGSGEIKAIEYQRIAPVPTESDSSAVDSLVAQLLRRGLTSANATLLEQDRFPLGETNVQFVAASYPAGSAALDMRTGKNFDAVRGLLGFIRGEFTYVLTGELKSRGV